jgi:hypothetical protein
MEKQLPFELKCLRCGNEWVRRGQELPEVCPQCKSRKWQTAPVAAKDEKYTASEKRTLDHVTRILRHGSPEQRKLMEQLAETFAKGVPERADGVARER